MKHLETLQERCQVQVGHHLESYPPDILSRLPGTFVAGILPHLCQHHLNNCHDDILQTGVDPNPVWHTLFASHFKWESRMMFRHVVSECVVRSIVEKTIPSDDGCDEDKPDWRQQYLQRYFHKLLWYRSRPPRPQEDNREPLLLSPSCSDRCLRAAQDLMLYAPHVHRLLLYDSRAFNYILQDQPLHRCLLENVSHLEIHWFRGVPGVGTFLRRCLSSPVSKLEKLTMHGVPGGTDRSALQLLSLCAGSETEANSPCLYCNNKRKDSCVHGEDFLGHDDIDVEQGGLTKTTIGPHSSRIPPLHSDETFHEQDQASTSHRRTDSSNSVDETVTVRDERTSDSEDLYDIANSDTDSITGDDNLPLVVPLSTKHQATVREVVLHDVLTSTSLVTSFCDLLKTWYNLERISISGGSYDSLPKDDVVSSLLECQRKGGKLTHLFLENELLCHWTFPNILLSLLQAKQSYCNAAANSCAPDLQQLKLHHCMAFGQDASHWRPVCWNSFPMLSSDGVISGIVSVDLSFCVPTLEAHCIPSRPLDMNALMWLLTHDSAIRSLRLHNCQLYTEELATVFNAISEAPDFCKLEMLDVSFNNYRSEKGSGALAQLISKSRLTCLKMEVVSSTSAGDAGVETLMQVFAPGGHSCLQVLALRSNLIHTRGLHAINQALWKGRQLKKLLIGGNFFLTEAGGLPAFMDSNWFFVAVDLALQSYTHSDKSGISGSPYQHRQQLV
uniref:Leucine-rich repeat-containing protein 41 n=1 Tax=Branchiostoma floridae TaxID=7739 RepID=C3ZPN7_BRAFL|eukprot:XP_002589523.1 hypothetical protein BRAFLDRAFT_125210 [Branchiostoma floridae]